MSDFGRSSVTDSAFALASGSQMDSADPVGEVISAGALIRKNREAIGLHIAALAVLLKVPVKKLEALEADRFDLLPDAVFVRALASSVCRTLKIDAAPVLQRLPLGSSPRLTYGGMDINTPFRAPGDAPGPSIWARLLRPPVFSGLILLLGALIIVLLPDVKVGFGQVSTDAMTASSNNGAPKVNAGSSRFGAANVGEAKFSIPAHEPVSFAATSSVAGASTSQALASAAAGSVLPASFGTGLAPEVLVAPAEAASAILPASTGIVVFSAKGQSWVEVTDSKGVVVLRRNLSAGEVAGASGALPLSAIVGRADATQVQVRGKAFDLSAFSRDNVARFEVR